MEASTYEDGGKPRRKFASCDSDTAEPLRLLRGLLNMTADFPMQLRRQMAFIERSAAAYDTGAVEEAR